MLLFVFRTLSQIIVAGVAINAFALLLYASYFNLKDRVAFTFVLILISLVILYSAEAIGSILEDPAQIATWLKIEWVGIILLPAVYYHFSEALLYTTGKAHKGRISWLTITIYGITAVLLAALPFPQFFNTVVMSQQPAHLEENWVTLLFTAYYILLVALAWRNFITAYKRTKTPTTRRRMVYLLIAAVAPALGSFPFMLFGSGFAGRHPLVFWVSVASVNTVVAGLINIMAYSVSFYGVSWPQRVIKSRLFKWILRGPVLAGLTLAAVTIISRVGRHLNFEGTTTLTTVVMLLMILGLQYTITLFRPLGERLFLFVDDDIDIEKLQAVEDRLLTRNDLDQLAEMLLSTACDNLQASNAAIIPTAQGLESFEVAIGEEKLVLANSEAAQAQLQEIYPGLFAQDASDRSLLIRLPDKQLNAADSQLGWMVLQPVDLPNLNTDQLRILSGITTRIANAMSDWLATQSIYDSLQEFSYEDEWLMRSRGRGQVDATALLDDGHQVDSREVSLWVRDALTHYWGGPKFTKNPLLKLNVVQAAMAANDNNPSKGLRSILKQAIEETRPAGERKFTSEWLIYNILDMKFVEGKRVKEIALKLSVSEADLYRKQRLAIETVSEHVLKMEEASK